MTLHFLLSVRSDISIVISEVIGTCFGQKYQTILKQSIYERMKLNQMLLEYIYHKIT